MYKARVKYYCTNMINLKIFRYYQDIQLMPAISDQDMNAMLAEESRVYMLAQFLKEILVCLKSLGIYNNMIKIWKEEHMKHFCNIYI